MFNLVVIRRQGVVSGDGDRFWRCDDLLDETSNVVVVFATSDVVDVFATPHIRQIDVDGFHAARQDDFSTLSDRNLKLYFENIPN